MNAATKSTTASKSTPESKSARKPRVAPPALDFSTLTVEDAAAPTRSVTRQDNPFMKPMEESAANRTPGVKGAWKGAGKAVTVPNANVTQVKNYIRYAANDLGVGSAIVEEPAGKGMTKVTFCAKSRKAARNGGSE